MLSVLSGLFLEVHINSLHYIFWILYTPKSFTMYIPLKISRTPLETFSKEIYF